MFNSIPYCIIYDIVHIWTIHWVLVLDIHMQISVPQNIDLFCGLVLMFLCLFLSVSDNDGLFIIASDKSQLI